MVDSSATIPAPLGGAERPARRASKARFWVCIAFLMLAALVGTAVGGGIHFYRAVWHIPSLVIDESHLDLGSGKPNEVMRGSLRLKNTGRAPLEFTAQGSCGCTSLKPGSGTVMPGGELEVAVALTLASHTNSERAVQISIKSNDPRRSEVQCSAKARCPGPCRLNPAFINFGQLTRAQLASAGQLLRISPNEGDVPLDAGSLVVETRSRAFRIEASSEDSVKAEALTGATRRAGR